MEGKIARLERKGLSQRGKSRGKKRTNIGEGRDCQQWRMEREGEERRRKEEGGEPQKGEIR
ncbi:hypothetical protein SLEP1_g37100 [Rubroshorea leprosula]|uniref:Uncharacterized protein n=1 Tax=Rubroshorea leprosula TaxID=152421 RepID=A0AAV5KUA8_9ROSI|nr:hypothetical protein SLEP1_g37100 [Rubroshorea leprosula]